VLATAHPFFDNPKRVKCPKCHYLGFETGTRCRHCGYDFSLLPLSEASAPPALDDLALRAPDASAAGGRPWVDAPLAPATLPEPPHDGPPVELAAAGYDGSAGGAAVRHQVDSGLPLFAPASPSDDQPLIRVPAVPRPPLAVRRTPDLPRVKVPASLLRRDGGDPAHEPDGSVLAGGPRLRDAAPYATVDADLHRHDGPLMPSRGAVASGSRNPEPAAQSPARGAGAVDGREACAPGPRLTAALIDLAILLAIDLAIVYFTLKMAGLSASEWRVLPSAPLVAFLTLLKLAYFSAFTAFGGQTIGKMAAHIRVVAEDDSYLDPARAVRRTCAAVASVLTLGAGFAPALVGPTRQALHDRLARTRVVALPSA
jgi:uncharacterized RDD family membrane protein YckC